jgi:hypothetical protein
MGFLDRFRTSPQATRFEALTLLAGDTRDVVGESFRQDGLERVAAIATTVDEYLDELSGKARGIGEKDTARRWFRAALFRDYNEHDHNSVCVHAAGVGLIGYLDRLTAIDYAGVFAELERQGVKIGACPAYLIGGGPGQSWGVVLALSSPEEVITDLRENG